MSMSANVEPASSGMLRTSPTRLRVNTVEPAPMNAILGIWTAPPSRGRVRVMG